MQNKIMKEQKAEGLKVGFIISLSLIKMQKDKLNILLII